MTMLGRRSFLAGSLALAGAAALPATRPARAAVADLDFASALDAAWAIRAGQISSVELTSRMLERIARHNPPLNAIVMLAAACGSSKSNGKSGSTSGEKIVVGRKNFSGAELVSDIYGGALAAKGFKVSYKDVGPTEQTYAALKKGSIDLYGEYQGTLLTFLKGAPTADPAAVNAALMTKLAADNLTTSSPSTARPSAAVSGVASSPSSSWS